ncbi:MAG: NAD(+)/NADH kinase [Ignavibacterium sp.]|nr:NAD(+)/NADH kinase [Ignavibacterium sp.]MDW8375502.1 NAD(+)/NADH kinase [Ignavibacteriales bacterium]
MKLGIVANITKENILEVVSSFTSKLKDNNIDYILTKSLLEADGKIKIELFEEIILSDDELYKNADIIISIGGDGTMLNTAFNALKYEKPVLGINIGKLGFLVEAELSQMDFIIDCIKNKNYKIDERIVISGDIFGKQEQILAFNDIVIDKGSWHKMIELSIWVDDEYVSTFNADGIIIATPTGSTGYSISVGGPIISPKADVVSLSPISPHSLTVKPLVLPSNQEILIKADSLHNYVQVSCDGQRAYNVPPPMEIKIKKSEKKLKLISTSLSSYFSTLRKKLLWGIDIRHSNKEGKER